LYVARQTLMTTWPAAYLRKHRPNSISLDLGDTQTSIANQIRDA
jgi:hypothetical protein